MTKDYTATTFTRTKFKYEQRCRFRTLHLLAGFGLADNAGLRRSFNGSSRGVSNPTYSGGAAKGSLA